MRKWIPIVMVLVGCGTKPSPTGEVLVTMTVTPDQWVADKGRHVANNTPSQKKAVTVRTPEGARVSCDVTSTTFTTDDPKVFGIAPTQISCKVLDSAGKHLTARLSTQPTPYSETHQYAVALVVEVHDGDSTIAREGQLRGSGDLVSTNGLSSE